MIAVSIKKDGIETNFAQFNSMEEAQAWIARHEQMGSFGRKAIFEEQDVLISEEVRGPVQELATPAVYDNMGNELEPATYTLNPDGVVSPAVYERRVVMVLPSEYTIDIQDKTAELAAKAALDAKIAAGKKAREACQSVLDLVAGFNIDRELTSEQISQLQSMMAAPEAALRASRPSMAKALISAVTPDGDLVTQEMKDAALGLLSEF